MTPPPRTHPFALVFGDIAPARFPAVAAVLPPDAPLDAFLVAAPALELLQDLRPDEGLGDEVDDFVAFVHAAWAWWAAGAVTVPLDAAATRALCGPGRPDPAAPRVRYIQVAPRVLWGQLPGEAHWEPLDGWFTVPTPAGLRVVACLGVHPDRPGLSVLVAEGPPPELSARADGSAAHAPLMEGGERAGLHAVASPEELLALAWRAAAHHDDPQESG